MCMVMLVYVCNCGVHFIIAAVEIGGVLVEEAVRLQYLCVSVLSGRGLSA